MFIRIPEGKAISRVKTLVEGNYQQRNLGDVLEVSLSRVEAYQAVAVTFE